ncbi:MAG: OmpA family protein [Kofleriaceae bacterium]
MKSAIAILLLGSAGTAAADRWMSAEIPSAVAVSEQQNDVFRAGAMPAVGGYQQLGQHFALGMRVRAGVLRNGTTAPGNNRMDPSTGGLATVGVAARFTVGGTYLELVGGGGVTGSDVVPAFEAGIGYLFDFEHVSIGPSVRYVRVVADAHDALGSADLALFGVDFQFGKDRHRIAHDRYADPEVGLWKEPVAKPVAPPPPPPVVEEKTTPDGDVVADSLPSCMDLVEYLDDASGCGPGKAIEVVGDRIILDDRVLFDSDRAHVHAAGREMIAAIVKAAQHHPEWLHVTIEGHADVRGPDDYNQSLSELRAERTRDQMIKAGFPADKITVVGYGRTKPRDPGMTPEAHQRNRRVEFQIDRAGAKK